MSHSLIIVLGLAAILAGNLAYAVLTTKELVERAGYQFEAHQVETEDGYLIEIHRIPSSPKNQSCKAREVVLLAHGLLTSSSDFVVLRSENALAFLLADKCFDVWMLNIRGNRYGRKHVSLDPDNLLGKFWDFSFHEIGTRDLPAIIDHVREKTGSDELHYIGHSLGTTIFFVLTSLNEKYQGYIKSGHMMTPLIYSDQIDAEYLRLANTLISTLSPLPNLVGSTEFNPNGTITKIEGAVLCDSEPRKLCSDDLFVILGFNNITVDSNIIDDVLSITPAGMSFKSVLQCFQQYDSNRFQQYDYGFLGNLRRYGTSKPPTYPVEKVKVPIYLYWGGSDRFVHKQDIERIKSTVQNVKNDTLIDFATHTTFMYNSDMKKLVYEDIMNRLMSMQ